MIETTTAAGQQVKHRFTQQAQEARGLVIILPGRGYLIEHPALHYLSKMAAELGYDVLSVRYAYQMSVGDFPTSTDYEALSAEVDLAVDAVLALRQYQRVCIAGKSMGTPLAVRLGERFKTVDLRYILLTPIANATDGVGDHPSLAVIGTADPAYDSEKVTLDSQKPYLQWYVLDGLNHGLEFETGWNESITGLKQIITECEAFLRL
jgi:acetyl esterase/lipase